ncbi:hypothetical protein DMA11_13790 [Marinilabiliaceae bacterium JC017]|nr:hypothetical protein DMA11_13790 [Marinilabiliaceae bacterium JC017]
MGKSYINNNHLQKKGIVQLERFVDNKTSGIHLHLDIGKGDHLMIGGDRYNLMAGSSYSEDRVKEAQNALRDALFIRDKVAC